MKNKILNAMVIGFMSIGAAHAAEANTPAQEAKSAVDSKELDKKAAPLVSEETKKEIKEFHAKKKELWENLSPEAKRVISAQKHRRYKKNKEITAQ
jgi:hypothetical protein